jgi:hypothetical protein
MSLSDRAVISFINTLFGTHHPLDCSVSRLSTETVDHSLRGSLADMVIIIAGRFFYVIETQIGDDNARPIKLRRLS